MGGVAWHPKATISLNEDLVNLVSGAADENVCLWSLNRCVLWPFHGIKDVDYSQ